MVYGSVYKNNLHSRAIFYSEEYNLFVGVNSIQGHFRQRHKRKKNSKEWQYVKIPEKWEWGASFTSCAFYSHLTHYDN